MWPATSWSWLAGTCRCRRARPCQMARSSWASARNTWAWPAPARVRQVQDVGTHLMLSAEVQGTVLKARLGVEWLKLAPGDEVWLQLLGQHTCFYVNEELVS